MVILELFLAIVILEAIAILLVSIIASLFTVFWNVGILTKDLIKKLKGKQTHA